MGADQNLVKKPKKDENDFDDDEIEDIDISDWRDERVTYYWFLRTDIENYCKKTAFDYDKYIQSCSKDDVDCDLLQQFEYAFKFTEKE